MEVLTAKVEKLAEAPAETDLLPWDMVWVKVVLAAFTKRLATPTKPRTNNASNSFFILLFFKLVFIVDLSSGSQVPFQPRPFILFEHVKGSLGTIFGNANGTTKTKGPDLRKIWASRTSSTSY